MSNFMLVLVILLALIFDFINGFHDTANSIATVVSTRVLTPRHAIIMSAILNFVGALVSVKVATTIASEIVNSGGTYKLQQYVIAAALCGAIIWNLATWYMALPSSSSHALIGSLIGAAIIDSGGTNVIYWKNIWSKVIFPLFTSPVVGFVMGYFVMKLLFFLLKPLSQKTVNKWFSKLQIFSAALMAYSHGSNDAQKTMGIITLALVSGGVISTSAGVPIVVKLICAISMALGTSVGGYRIIKTVGMNMIKLQPIGGFAAETSAAAVIQVMTAFGAPVSTTHVISTAIMGVGSSKRFSAVNWSVAKDIVTTWFITLPITALLGAGITLIFRLFV